MNKIVFYELMRLEGLQINSDGCGLIHTITWGDFTYRGGSVTVEEDLVHALMYFNRMMAAKKVHEAYGQVTVNLEQPRGP